MVSDTLLKTRLAHFGQICDLRARKGYEIAKSFIYLDLRRLQARVELLTWSVPSDLLPLFSLA